MSEVLCILFVTREVDGGCDAPQMVRFAWNHVAPD